MRFSQRARHPTPLAISRRHCGRLEAREARRLSLQAQGVLCKPGDGAQIVVEVC